MAGPRNITSVLVVGASPNELSPAAKDLDIAKAEIADTIAPTVSHEETTATLAMPESSPELAACRKALEAALYDNMETPRERLIRCRYSTSADAEYHAAEYHAVDEENFVGEMLNKVKCLDDNGFEIVPLVTGLTIADMTTSNHPRPSLSINDLFARVAATGASKVGITDSPDKVALISNGPRASANTGFQFRPSAEVFRPSSHSLQSVEHEIRSQLPTITTYSVRNGSLEHIGAGMRPLVHFSLPGTTYPIDPAIVSYKIKQQPLRDTATQATIATLPANTLRLPLGITTPFTCPHDPSSATSQTTRTSSRVSFNPQARPSSSLTSQTVSPSQESQAGWVAPVGVINAPLVSPCANDFATREELEHQYSRAVDAYKARWAAVDQGYGFRGRRGERS